MTKPFATVALPLYEMGTIAELAIESLCNQVTSYKWELIICEEKDCHDLFGRKITDYIPSLTNAGCVRVEYIQLDERLPLGMKWKKIAENASDTICFLLTAGDNYNHQARIHRTCHAFEHGIDYYDEQMGYFYSFRLNKTFLFNPHENNYRHPCRLNMAWSTELIKRLPDNNQKKSVDKFIYHQLSKLKKLELHREYLLYSDSVHTDGFNHISNRTHHFTHANNIYFPAGWDICEIVTELDKFKGHELTKIK